MIKLFIKSISFLMVLLWMTANSEAEVQRIILEHADTLKTRRGIRYLIGNVKVRQRETLITSQRARYNPKTGGVVLEGNVVMIEPKRRIEADKITYSEISGNFEAFDNVDMLYGDSLRIRCDVMRYFAETKTADLFGNVIIDNMSDAARITGTHGIWNQAQESGVIDRDPVYSLPDDEGDPPDTLVIISNILRFNRAERTALFVGEVNLNHTEIRSVSDTLLHLPDSSLTILTGNPVIWRENDKLTGDRVELYYEDRLLTKMIAKGNAVVVSKPEFDDVHKDRLTGDKLTMTRIDDSTRTVLMEGDAQAEYYVWSEEMEYQGLNLSASDSIELTLVLDKATAIMLEGRAECSFYPPGQEPEGMIKKSDHVRK